MAQNAGEFWGRSLFQKSPGTITVSIGEPIDSTGLKADELNSRVEQWIEEEMQRIGDYGTQQRAAAVSAKTRSQPSVM